MKIKLLIAALLATLLAGCIVVPAHPYAYRPVPRVYIY
jgi:acyl-CoA synthetase (AMP-forming)/AMP-acid ligase II